MTRAESSAKPMRALYYTIYYVHNLLCTAVLYSTHIPRRRCYNPSPPNSTLRIDKKAETPPRLGSWRLLAALGASWRPRRGELAPSWGGTMVPPHAAAGGEVLSTVLYSTAQCRRDGGNINWPRAPRWDIGRAFIVSMAEFVWPYLYVCVYSVWRDGCTAKRDMHDPEPAPQGRGRQKADVASNRSHRTAHRAEMHTYDKTAHL